MMKRIRQTSLAAMVALGVASGAFAATQAEAEAAIRTSTNIPATLRTLLGNTSAVDLAAALMAAGVSAGDTVSFLQAAGATPVQIAGVSAAYIAQLPVADRPAARAQVQAAIDALPPLVSAGVKVALAIIVANAGQGGTGTGTGTGTSTTTSQNTGTGTGSGGGGGGSGTTTAASPGG